MTFLYAMQLTSRAKSPFTASRIWQGSSFANSRLVRIRLFPVNRVLLGIEIPLVNSKSKVSVSITGLFRPFSPATSLKFFMMGISNKSLTVSFIFIPRRFMRAQPRSCRASTWRTSVWTDSGLPYQAETPLYFFPCFRGEEPK